jgi:PAS domain S-box-containing protein
MGRKPTYEELERRVKCLEKEAGKRKKADGVLYQSKEKYQNILGSIEEGYYEVDLAGNLTFFNDSLCKIYGYARDELMGMNNRDYMTTETAKRTYEIFNRVYKTGEPTKIFDWKFIKKDGTEVDVEISVSLIRNPKGQAIGFRGIVRDIRERKMAEQKLQESKAMLKAVIENLPFDVFAIDRNNHYILQNETCTKNWGNFIGKSPEDITIDKQTKDFWLKNNRRALSGETVTGEVVYDRVDGGKNFYYNIIAPICDEKKTLGIVGVLVDISTLKETEELLRESKQRFRNLTEITSDWIWEVDKNGFYTYVSPKIRDMLGYEPEEIIGKTPFDLMPPEEADRVTKIFNNISASQKTFDCLENLNLHKDGHPVVLETSGIRTFSDAGEFLGYRGIDRDITKRKRTEELLRKQAHDLDERVKKLNCFYGISKVRERPDIAFEEMLQEIVDLIPASWQYPEITCARIIIEGQEYKTKNFKETVWKQTSNIVVHGKLIGILEICYIEKKPESDEGPFQKEERHLISSIAERLGRVTEHKRAEGALRKAHDELESRVAERTRELKIERSNLEEANIALQVLLEKRQEDKKEIEDSALTNVKELIVPYIEKIRRTKLDDQQKAILSIIESYLNEIISPFTRKMSLKYLNLTPTEIQVANLIRHGSNSKEIAEFMGLSPRTIYNHRKNIRKKFGLENKKTNLRSHLLSLH